MDPLGVVDSPIPLADITNNINQGSMNQYYRIQNLVYVVGSICMCLVVLLLGVLDRRERRRQRDRERYASMSTEKKDELNRKSRERRMEQKICDGGIVYLKHCTHILIRAGWKLTVPGI
jgi:hypothetical protein